MQSLLDKVKEVEKEAASLVEKAEAQGNQAISTLTGNEESMLAETKARAEQRAQAVITEKVAAAKEEANKLKQEREQSLGAIAKAAETNRERALEYAMQTFGDYFSEGDSSL